MAWKQITPKRAAELDAYVEGAFKEHQLAGLAVGIVRGDKLRYTACFGHANIERGTPITPQTVFRAASFSKSMTAVAVMQLWEQGKIALDAPANDYLKAFKIALPDDVHSPEITIWQLLTHTSGLGDYFSWGDAIHYVRTFFGIGVDEDTPQIALKDYYDGLLPAMVRPGSKYVYTNHGYAALGQLIEDVAGQPFADYMRQRIFDPLGMGHTDFVLNERVKAHLATGYTMKGRPDEIMEHVPVKYTHFYLTGAAGVFTTLEDMGKFVSVILKNGGDLIKPDTLAEMLKPHYRLDDRLDAVGLGFKLPGGFGGFGVNSKRVLRHGGWINGFRSAMYIAPDDDWGVVVLTNTAIPVAGNIAAQMIRRVLETPDMAESLPELPAPRFLFNALSGHYKPTPGRWTNFREWVFEGGELNVYVDDDNRLMLRSLVGKWRDGLPLRPIDPDDPLAFAIVHDGEAIPIIFKRGASGAIDRLCINYSVFERKPFTETVRFRAQMSMWALVVLVLLAVLRLGTKKKA